MRKKKSKEWIPDPELSPRKVFEREIKPTLVFKAQNISVFMVGWSIGWTILLLILSPWITFLGGLGGLLLLPLMLWGDSKTRHSKGFLWVFLSIICFVSYIGAYYLIQLI